MLQRLESLRLDGTVGQKNLEALLHAPNHSSSLGIIAVSDLVLMRPEMVPLKVWIPEGHALFEVLSIHRQRTEENKVAGEWHDTGTATHELHDHISALGKLQHVAIGGVVLGANRYVNYDLVTLDVSNPSREVAVWPVTIALPYYQETDAY